MRRVKRIGNLTLQNPLWVEEHEEISEFFAEQQITAAGSVVQWVTSRQNLTLSLSSKSNEFVTETERAAILDMYRDVGAEYEIESTDGEIAVAIFDYTKTPKFIPAQFGIRYYYVELYMILK
jgi:hypothetical protein